MNEIILQIMDKFGYFGIAFLISIENVFPPIPSEVILTFGGFMTSNTNMTITGVIIVSTIGSVIGAIILYLLGRLLTKERLYKLVDGRIGKILRFKKQDIDKSEEWFSKKGKSTVLFCRFIPMVRSLISIPAGMTKMEFSLFLTYTIIGSAIWNSVLTYLGFAAGNAWESVAKYVDYFAKITLIMFACVVCVCGFIVYKKRKFEKLR